MTVEGIKFNPKTIENGGTGKAGAKNEGASFQENCRQRKRTWRLRGHPMACQVECKREL